jgi:enolase-like protein
MEGSALKAVRAAAYRIPTDGPEADGTFSWNATTLVVVRVRAGDAFGIGYTYADADDLDGLRLPRERTPPALDVAAGEYIYRLEDAQRLLAAGTVDVLQADATRCGGITGFLKIAALCEAHHIDLSAHCAPALHCQVARAAGRLRHVEWFHDHVRIEQQFSSRALLRL